MSVLSAPSHMPATLLVASYQLLPYLISQPAELIITLRKDRLLEFCILNHPLQVTRGQEDPSPRLSPDIREGTDRQRHSLEMVGTLFWDRTG